MLRTNKRFTATLNEEVIGNIEKIYQQIFDNHTHKFIKYLATNLPGAMFGPKTKKELNKIPSWMLPEIKNLTFSGFYNMPDDRENLGQYDNINIWELHRRQYYKPGSDKVNPYKSIDVELDQVVPVPMRLSSSLDINIICEKKEDWRTNLPPHSASMWSPNILLDYNSQQSDDIIAAYRKWRENMSDTYKIVWDARIAYLGISKQYTSVGRALEDFPFIWDLLPEDAKKPIVSVSKSELANTERQQAALAQAVATGKIIGTKK